VGPRAKDARLFGPAVLRDLDALVAGSRDVPAIAGRRVLDQ
jgi:hypothetical protein